MQDERPVQLVPEDFTQGEPPLEDQGYWRKKMTPLPRFLMRKRGYLVEKEDPFFSSPPSSLNQDPQAKNNSSSWRKHKEKNLILPNETLLGLQKFPYQPSIQGRYVLVMTKLSMWTIAFSLLLLGVLFYLGGFFSAVYILRYSDSSSLKLPISKENAIDQKIETFMNKVEHKDSATPSSNLPTTSSQQPQTFPPQSPSGTISPIGIAPSSHPTSTPPSSPPKIGTSAIHTEQQIAHPISPGMPYFMIQFGQFRTKEEAIKLAQELLKKKYSIKIYRGLDYSNKLWFYVRANAYSSREAAEAAIKTFPPQEQKLYPLIIPSSLNQNEKVVFP